MLAEPRLSPHAGARAIREAHLSYAFGGCVCLGTRTASKMGGGHGSPCKLCKHMFTKIGSMSTDHGQSRRWLLQGAERRLKSKKRLPARAAARRWPRGARKLTWWREPEGRQSGSGRRKRRGGPDRREGKKKRQRKILKEMGPGQGELGPQSHRRMPLARKKSSSGSSSSSKHKKKKAGRWLWEAVGVYFANALPLSVKPKAKKSHHKSKPGAR